jgi:hypothetical protein
MRRNMGSASWVVYRLAADKLKPAHHRPVPHGLRADRAAPAASRSRCPRGLSTRLDEE